MSHFTKHGKRRFSRRLTPSLTPGNYIRRVLTFGLTLKELPFHILSKMKVTTNRKCRIYSQAIHFFTPDDNLITTYRLPAEFIPEVDRLCADKRKRIMSGIRSHQEKKESRSHQKYLAKQGKRLFKEYIEELRSRLDPLF